MSSTSQLLSRNQGTRNYITSAFLFLKTQKVRAGNDVGDPHVSLFVLQTEGQRSKGTCPQAHPVSTRGQPPYSGREYAYSVIPYQEPIICNNPPELGHGGLR